MAYIQTDIEIGATPQTRGNLIATQFSYDIWWSGTWCLAGTLTSFKEGRVDVWLDVYERATPNLIFREQVHSMDIQADFGFFEGLVGAGGGDDEGSRVGSFTVILRRGQQYTVRLTLRGRTDLGIAVGYIGLNYDDNDKGAGWNDLRVTVGQDARGVVAGLQAQIDSLRTDFERHGHVYLTGRGEGHNNTEAETSRPIYFEEMEETPAFLEDQEKRVPLPIRSALFGSAPNPVAGVSTIRYELPVASQVSIRLYNVHGQVVRTLVDDPRPPGRHETELDASGLAAGVYFYSLRTPQYFETRKVVISK